MYVWCDALVRGTVHTVCMTVYMHEYAYCEHLVLVAVLRESASDGQAFRTHGSVQVNRHCVSRLASDDVELRALDGHTDASTEASMTRESKIRKYINAV